MLTLKGIYADALTLKFDAEVWRGRFFSSADMVLSKFLSKHAYVQVPIRLAVQRTEIARATIYLVAKRLEFVHVTEGYVGADVTSGYFRIIRKLADYELFRRFTGVARVPRLRGMVIVAGSVARGTAKEGSDLDLILVEYTEMVREIERAFGRVADPLVLSEDELKERALKGDPYIFSALSWGIIISLPDWFEFPQHRPPSEEVLTELKERVLRALESVIRSVRRGESDVALGKFENVLDGVVVLSLLSRGINIFPSRAELRELPERRAVEELLGRMPDGRKLVDVSLILEDVVSMARLGVDVIALFERTVKET